MPNLISHDVINSFYRTLPFVWIDNVFPLEELARFDNFSNELNLGGATIGTDELQATDTSFRNTKIAFLNFEPQYYWIFEKIDNIFSFVNNNYYNFDITGYDNIQYAEYSEGMFYKRHIDMHFNMPSSGNLYNAMTRKLSMSILLNDNYDGGDFLLDFSQTEFTKLEKIVNRAYIFPSFLAHEVTPVISGTRKSIVSWLVGPKWK